MTTDKTSLLSARKRELLMLRLKKNAVARPPATPIQAIAAAGRGPIPLSWEQQRLWFLDQLDHAAGAAYHMPLALNVKGRLDRAALRAALDRIVARHESLRTRFIRVDGVATQDIVAAGAGFDLTESDLRQLPPEQRARAVDDIADAEATLPFDLGTGPLLRGRLLHLAEDEHVLLITQHHIISDGWSVAIFMREMGALYGAFSQGLPDPLAPPALQYADYALWQRARLRDGGLRPQLDFWRGHLAGAPALLELPLDRPRPAVQSHAGADLRFNVPAELTLALRALGQRHGATLFMTMLAAWSALLARLSGQDDIVVGTPVANRPRLESEGMIGFFVNTLALRVRLDADPDVAGLLARVKASTLGAYEHADLPFEQVVEALKPPRSLSHSPLFQVMLSMNVADGAQAPVPGLSFAVIERRRATAHFDLSLSLSEAGDRLDATLEYASDLFDATSIERMAAHLLCLLRGMAADESRPVSRLPLLDEAGRQRILLDFNASAVAHPRGQLLHELFEARAAARPDAIALIDEGRGISYADLNRRANRIAHRLLALGLRPDGRVALCAERGPDLIAGMLGILKAGGAYLPLDPGYPAARLAFMLEDGAPLAVLCQAALRPRFAGGRVPLLTLEDGAEEDAAEEDAGGRADANPDARALGLRDSHLAYVIYTSGSTGVPKGVLIEHANVVNFVHAHARLCALVENDRVLQFASPAFDSSVAEIFPALSLGATLVLCPAHLRLPDAAFVAFLDAHRVSVADLPTSFWQEWGQQRGQQMGQQARAGQGAAAIVTHPASLRLLIVSGEKAERRHLAAWLADSGVAATRWLNNYGPTETTVNATAIAFDAATPLPAREPPIGRPIANARVYILDAQGQPVPLGVAGEIHIGGAGVARGYLNRPALTAERFIADPFGAIGERLYKTGDLGRWLADGNIDYLGRNDFQVKIRGFRIELGEIEARLAACEGVRDAVVLAREDQAGEQRLVAYLVAQDGAAPTAGALRAQLAASLAEHMLPAAFVTLAAMPLTPNGKLDRRALPAPDAAAVATRAYAAPRGAVEEAVARAWQDLLRLPRVGRDDHFFELGGHSLLAVQLAARLGRELGFEVAIRDLFGAPTLAAFAALLQAGAHAHLRSHLVPIRPQGGGRPLFLIHPGEGEVGYARDLAPHLPPELPVFGLAAAGFMRGETPLDSVEKMAAAYLIDIRRQQPQGPYRLAGWSAGGTIAYEIAHQLMGADQTVEFLGLIDTFGDYNAAGMRAPVDSDADVPAQLATLLAGAPATPAAARIRQLAAAGAIDAALAACQEAGLLPAGIETAPLLRHLAVRHAIHTALSRYVRPPMALPATLFAARDQPRADPALGWRRGADRVDIVALGGDHFSIMRAPHIARLGAALAAALAAAAAPVPAEQIYAPRINIQDGRPGVAPLFCVPGAGAGVTAFYNLAQALPDIPMHGLQPRGLDGVLVPHIDVPSAARAYIAAIRQVAPRGPYRLLGHSFGGWVAAEMARQLTEQGERIALLIVLDTKPPLRDGQPGKRYARVDMLLKLVGLFDLNLARPMGLTAADFAPLDQEAQLELLLARLIEVKLMSPRSSLQALRGIVRVFATNVNTDYRPGGAYAGPVHLVTVPDGVGQRDGVAELTRRWRHHAPATEPWDGPGNHLTLLAAPHVARLAAWLEPLLKGAAA